MRVAATQRLSASPRRVKVRTAMPWLLLVHYSKLPENPVQARCSRQPGHTHPPTPVLLSGQRLILEGEGRGAAHELHRADANAPRQLPAGTTSGAGATSPGRCSG